MQNIRLEKVKAIKRAIKSGKYDITTAIVKSAEKIADNPEALLWR